MRKEAGSFVERLDKKPKEKPKEANMANESKILESALKAFPSKLRNRATACQTPVRGAWRCVRERLGLAVAQDH